MSNAQLDVVELVAVLHDGGILPPRWSVTP